MDKTTNTYTEPKSYLDNYCSDYYPLSGVLKYIRASNPASSFDCSSHVSGLCNMSDGVTESTKTVLKERGGRYFVDKYNNGTVASSRSVMPTIVDEQIYKDDDGNPRAIRMFFSDNTETCVVLQDGDTYNFEHALSICITKKILDMITGGYGHQTYNKLVRKAKKVYNDNRAKEYAAQKQAEEEKRKYQKIEEKKRKRDERIEQEAREYDINVMKEAIIRALNEYKLQG